MINIPDEILNKYLDGELTKQEAAEVNSAISLSEEIRKRFNALKLVHDELSSLEEDQVSLDFTSTLMSRLPHRIKVPNSQKYFFAAISFLIVLICLGIVGYITVAIVNAVPAQSSSNSFVDSFNNFSSVFVSEVEKLLKGRSLSIIGSVFSFGILISGYFFFEYQKKLKSNLGR
jgi:anti-sigma factor RsiW